MRLNEGIQVEEVKACLLCRAAGAARYLEMRDKVYGAAGVWTINYCENCDFCWLGPRPSPSDVAKTYEIYHTHTVAHTKNSILSSLKHKVECRLLETEYGYEGFSHGAGTRLVGKLLSVLLPMAKEVAG